MLYVRYISVLYLVLPSPIHSGPLSPQPIFNLISAKLHFIRRNVFSLLKLQLMLA